MAEFIKLGKTYINTNEIRVVRVCEKPEPPAYARVRVYTGTDEYTQFHDKEAERFLRWFHHQMRVVDLDE